MKVVNNGVGIGEEFIKIIFNKAEELNVRKIYFTVYPKYTDLINFFSKYGFKYYYTKKTMNSNNEINEEHVYVREL
jgi:N-acetylglutamate synthase-like GNAT family acetyltransferase